MTLLALTVCLAARQGLIGDPNAATFSYWLAQLEAQGSLYLQLNGTVSFRGKTSNLVSNLSWYTTTADGKTSLEVELESWVDGNMVRRLVGDGNTLWAYNISKHEYSATSYGGFGRVRPDAYESDLLNDLNWSASGADGYLTKLLRQIYNNAMYSSWMPGVMSVNLQQDQAVTDPVNPNLVYTATATDNFYMYNGSPKRTVVFEIAPGLTSNAGATPVAGFENIYFNQVETIGQYRRETYWKITPYTGVTFDPAIFQPYPGTSLKGWRPIVTPKPVG